jgi:putative ABC transport system permease protein
MKSLRARLAQRYPTLFAIREAIGIGLDAIRAYKLRAGLTILGVVMGIMTVIGMSSIVAGLNASMAKQIESLGSSVLFIRVQGPGENLTVEERRRRRPLTLDEIQKIGERSPALEAVAPLELNPVSVIKYGAERVRDTQVIGSVPSIQVVRSFYVARGRFLTETDLNRATKVAVIGTDIVDGLFPFVDPLDKEILMDGARFRVVGVLEKQGKFMFQSRDNVIIVPIGSLQMPRRVRGSPWTSRSTRPATRCGARAGSASGSATTSRSSPRTRSATCTARSPAASTW